MTSGEETSGEGTPGEASQPWWVAAFGPDYLTVYAHRDDGAAAAEVAGLLPMLGNGPVLDACCGNGRHLAELRRRTLPAVGFDYSATLVQSANARGAVAGHVTRADVRAIPFTGGFSAVLVLFTAFGYFDEADNVHALAALARQLAPGGRLLLDLPDPERLRQSLVPFSERQAGDLFVSERRSLVGSRVVKDVTITRADGSSHAYQESVRLYTATEIAELAARVFLRVETCWSGLRGPTSDEGRQAWWLMANGV